MRIVIASTLDTKGRETTFLKERILEYGEQAVIIDCSILGRHSWYCDYDCEAVAAAAGADIEKLRKSRDKKLCIDTMKTGLGIILKSMHERGELDGVISIGGVQGTVMATGAMQELPLGVPKFMVSAVANGQATFGPFVGASDITIMHSIVDIAGANAILDRILAQAAGAVCGMVHSNRTEKPSRPGKKTIALTMGGVTTECLSRVQRLLEERDFEVVIFHCNGIGARAMENLVEQGEIDAVMDLTPHDIMDGLQGGLMPCGEDRLKKITRSGIPYLTAPGCADIILFGGKDKVPQPMKMRKIHQHNELHTHVKASFEEMKALGLFMAERLLESDGPVRILIPEKGFSQMNREGGPLYEPESDAGFYMGLTKALEKRQGKNLEILRCPLHINSSEFAFKCTEELLKIIM